MPQGFFRGEAAIPASPLIIAVRYEKNEGYRDPETETGSVDPARISIAASPFTIAASLRKKPSGT